MKQTLFVLLMILLTIACSSPDKEGYHGVVDLAQSVRPPLFSAALPVMGLSRNWLSREGDRHLVIEGTVKILLYIPRGKEHALSLGVVGDKRARFSYLLDGKEGTEKTSSALFPPLSPGLHEVMITSDRNVSVRSLFISWGRWHETLDDRASLDDIQHRMGVYELLHYSTFPEGRDHTPALLFKGNIGGILPMDEPRLTTTFHCDLFTLNGSGSVIFTLEGEGRTLSRKIDLPDPGESIPFNLSFPEGFVLKSVSVGLKALRDDDSFVLVRPCADVIMEEPGTNVILITLDTTRRDALGIYGADPSPTPNLDALADYSTLYTHAYAPTPWTLPSHATIMTGASPGRHGAGTWASFLGPDLPTLAERFTQKHYITAGFSGGELTKGKFGFSRGFYLYRDPYHFERRADDLTKDVLHFIREHRPVPFFIFINYFDPHAPYNAPEHYKEARGIPNLIKNLDEKETLWQLAQGFPEAWDRFMAGEIPIDEKSLEIIKRLYLAEVAFTDDAFGRLIDTLKENGIFQNTLIIVTADHGEFLGEHGLLTHTTRLYEPVIRVPLLVHQPRQSAGERIDRLVTLQDIFPTLIRLASLQAAPAPGAEDLLQPAHPHTYVTAEEHVCLPVHPLISWMETTPHLWTLVARDTKVILNEGAQTEVYNLKEDPGESRSLSPDSSPLVRSFKAYVKAEKEQWKTGGAHQSASLTAEEKKALSSLGYLQ